MSDLENENLTPTLSRREIEQYDEYAKNKQEFGLLTLAYLHKSPKPAKTYFVRFLLIITYIAQILIPIFLTIHLFETQTAKCAYFTDSSSSSGDQLNYSECFNSYWTCPRSAENVVKVLSFSVCCVYLSRLHVLALKYWKKDLQLKIYLLYWAKETFIDAIQNPFLLCIFRTCCCKDMKRREKNSNQISNIRVGERGGFIQLWSSIDIYMNTGFESIVYLINIITVASTSQTPLHVIFNSLALEYILTLDDTIKEIYLQTFKIDWVSFYKENTTPEKKIGHFIWFLACLCMDLANISVIVVLFYILISFVWLPVCMGKNASDDEL